MPPKKKFKPNFLGVRRDSSQNTSHSLSIAPPETSTASTPDDAPSRVDNQRSQGPLPSHPTPSVENSRPTPFGVAWMALKTALRILEKSADACPPLKSAVGGLVAVLDLQEAFTENREEYEKLATELTSIVKVLDTYVPALVARGVSGIIEHILNSIRTELAYIKQQQDRNKTMRIITADQDQGDVLTRYRTIESLFRQLQTDITFRIWDDLRKQGDDSKKQRDDSRKQTEATLLEKMDPVYDALYNSSYSTTIKRGVCTANTRKEVLGQLETWARDPNGAKIYWMNGLGRQQYLTPYMCRNVDKILPTLAHQLAHYSDSFRSMLCNILEKEPRVSRLAVKEQFQNLIQRPLQVITTTMPSNIIIVIDALDECEGGDGFLTTLLELSANLPFKFFIASRPEPVIYGKISASNYPNSILHLHNIDASIVGADIKKYLIEKLESMSPSTDEVEQLAKASGKLFIYAATAVRYICPGNPGVDSRTRLRTVLGMDNVSGPTELQYRDLDKLYTAILAAAVNPDCYEPHEINNTLLILGTVVYAKEPMATQTLALLLNLTEWQVRSSLQPLQSVLQTQDVEKVIAPFHTSFPDFICDKRRAKDFYFERTVHNEVLANRCFDLMKTGLRFNIYDLKSSFVFDEDVSDLPKISLALSYACQYWDEHLLQARLSNTVHAKLVDFLTCRLLFWVEVLTFTEYIYMHIDILRKIIVRLKVSRHTHNIGFQTEIKAKVEAEYSDATKQLADAKEFLTDLDKSDYRPHNIPHIYISKLTFWPRTSTVYKNYWRHTREPIEAAIKFITAASITKGAEVASASENNTFEV